MAANKAYKSRRVRVIVTALTVCSILLSFCLISVSAEEKTDMAEKRLCVGGFAFGVRFGTAGVLVLDTPSVISDGRKLTPALDAGIKVKDIITKVNGTEVNTAESISLLIGKSEGGADITVKRGESEITVKVIPVKEDVTGIYRAGLKLKDSMAGIGTVTYVDPETGNFGGLGHGICDPETGVLMPLRSGSSMSVEIGGVIKGKSGRPGEIKGYFLSERTGNVKSNTVCGVFGYFSSLPSLGEAIPVGTRNDVKEGKATVYSTLGDDGVKQYEVEISKIDRGSTDNKSFVITVTDPVLIERSGGIVQGMSGSPIVQDGKLVGAVTHVLISDPTRGYGVFIENMLNAAK
ncbi:MAG: SpoIVB peptidase [Clostridia bacterium]|nr:SpoIVB peptidase [Clostridia bacterium]